jgi:hypothetical protein
VDHPVDRLVMEDLVEGTEPRRRVVARHHEEPETLHPGRAAGPTFHDGRADLGHTVAGDAPREPVNELALADPRHAGDGHDGEAVPEQPADPLRSRCETGQDTAGHGRTQCSAT